MSQQEARFLLCRLNIRSMTKNVGAFENYIQLWDHAFTVLGFTETWLKDDDCGLFGIPGYAMVEKRRTVRPGGGVKS